jgi:hypothetical protein
MSLVNSFPCLVELAFLPNYDLVKVWCIHAPNLPLPLPVEIVSYQHVTVRSVTLQHAERTHPRQGADIPWSLSLNFEPA